jgi:hypothetical protein
MKYFIGIFVGILLMTITSSVASHYLGIPETTCWVIVVIGYTIGYWQKVFIG